MIKTYVQRLFSELVDGRQALVVDVVLQQVLQLAQAVGNPGNEKVHPAEVVVLVVVQKVLELRVEDLQVLLDQNFVAGLEQTVQGRLVQIDLRKEQFLIETLLSQMLSRQANGCGRDMTVSMNYEGLSLTKTD